mmetsp:Transcript_30936/g.40852  ORF Transcript_30936/g.40852 Transcript_30936/m.40852 type:complete len:115 (+) Transcript_30936:133-477(+)
MNPFTFDSHNTVPDSGRKSENFPQKLKNHKNPQKAKTIQSSNKNPVCSSAIPSKGPDEFVKGKKRVYCSFCRHFGHRKHNCFLKRRATKKLKAAQRLYFLPDRIKMIAKDSPLD